jgi:ribonucleotide reductase alpha subunit
MKNYLVVGTDFIKKKEVMEHGVRNSLLVAPMPTASLLKYWVTDEAFGTIYI